MVSMRLYLSPDQFERLTMKLDESGVFNGPSMELRTHTGGVFWLASGCHQGTYFLTAFRTRRTGSRISAWAESAEGGH